MFAVGLLSDHTSSKQLLFALLVHFPIHPLLKFLRPNLYESFRRLPYLPASRQFQPIGTLERRRRREHGNVWVHLLGPCMTQHFQPATSLDLISLLLSRMIYSTGLSPCTFWWPFPLLFLFTVLSFAIYCFVSKKWHYFKLSEESKISIII